MEFNTTDIILAAVLKIKGHSLESIDIENNKGIFNFIDVDEKLITEFDLGQSLVEPIEFNNAIKTLTTSVRRMNRN